MVKVEEIEQIEVEEHRVVFEFVNNQWQTRCSCGVIRTGLGRDPEKVWRENPALLFPNTSACKWRDINAKTLPMPYDR